MVVDDDGFFRSTLEEALLLQGYMVKTAADGRRALELVNREPFDLVLTDQNMPGVCGIELIKTLRRNFVSVRAILMSSLLSVELRSQALALGAEVCLDKPFSCHTLFDEIEKSFLSVEINVPVATALSWEHSGIYLE